MDQWRGIQFGSLLLGGLAAGAVLNRAARTTATAPRATRERLRRRLRVHQELSAQIAAAVDPGAALPSVLLSICEGTGWEACLLWRVDAAGRWWCEGSCGLGGSVVSEMVRVGGSNASAFSSTSLSSLQPVVWCARLGSSASRLQVNGRSVLARSSVTVAVRWRNRVLGAVQLLSRPYRFWDPELIGWLDAICWQLGHWFEKLRVEQALLKATENLKRSNAELEQFAYLASHDLLEPLRMITSYLGLLRDSCGTALGAEDQEYLGYAVEGAQRMRGLITDLLAYSRIHVNEQKLTPVESEEALQFALRNLRVAIQESGGKVEHEPLPRILADMGQLTQLFQNLIGNALKFRGAAPPRVRVSVTRTGGTWEFRIADNGIGLHPKDFDRIFVIFQRLHTRQEYPGTGIGLALCKKIVERHGGRIWVDSGPEEGSTFHFTLRAE